MSSYEITKYTKIQQKRYERDLQENICEESCTLNPQCKGKEICICIVFCFTFM